MAKPITQGRTIDLLPKPIRDHVIEMLFDHQPSRAISAWLLQQGHKLSFAAVARYRRENLPKHLAIAAKLRQLNALENHPLAERWAAADITKQIQAADPLLERVNAKYARYDEMLSKSMQAKDFSGFASIDRAETQSIQLHAALTGRLNQSPSVSQLVVILPTPSRHDGEIIDIQPVTATSDDPDPVT